MLNKSVNMYHLWYNIIMERNELNKLKVKFYKSANGNEPVRDWIKSLSEEDKTIIGKDIKTVQYFWPLGKPLVDHIEGDIWEIRSNITNKNIARVLFFVEKDRMILLNGFIKKTQKTPKQEKDLAKARYKEIKSNE